jgi:hypothetical protein
MEGLLKLPNVTLLKHDVDKNDLPAGRFDLIQTRLVRMHGGIDRAAVVRKLISSAKARRLVSLGGA